MKRIISIKVDEIWSVVFLLAVFVAIYGWIANIVKIAFSVSEGFTAELLIRLIGVFAAPLGSIMGFF